MVQQPPKKWQPPRWYWPTVVVGVLIDFALWFGALSLLGVIDQQLGLTLLYVEVPIGVIVSVIVSNILRESGRQAQSLANAMQKMEDRKRRIAALEGHLANHYQGILQTMVYWFEDNPPATSPFDGPKLTYLIPASGRPCLGVANWYSPNPRTTLKTLEVRDYVKDEASEVEAHLQGENWDKWIRLTEKVNDHLTKVKKAWSALENDIRTETARLGLKEWNGTTAPPGRPIEYYWMHYLFVNTWIDPDYFAAHDRHLWDDEEIKEDEDSHHKTKTWGLGFGQVQSKDKDVLVRLKEWLNMEGLKTDPQKRKLLDELWTIEEDYKNLRAGWLKVEMDYRNGIATRLPNSCPTCKPLLNDLAGLGA